MKTDFLLPLLIFSGALHAASPVRFEPYEYEFEGARIHAELGRFSVPEKYASPGGRQIKLAFLRFASTSAKPGPPIVYLAGGPGGSGISIAKGPRGKVLLAMREAADVIALDQRGTGLSEPNLDCPGSLGFPLNSPGDSGPLLELLNRRSRECAAYWKERGVDLTAYNVVESARDLDSLREALAVGKISLLASSYGTTLGLTALHHFGQHIYRAVLAGIEAPDQTYKLPGVGDRQLAALEPLIAHDPELRKKIPNLTELVRRVLSRAEREPFTVSVTGEKGAAARITLGRFDLEQLVSDFIGTRAGLARLPGFFLALDTSQLTSPLVQQAARQLIEFRTRSIGSAMSYAMDCSTGASEQRLAAIGRETPTSLLGAAVNFPFPEICRAWGVPLIPEVERAYFQSDTPVLFISGTLDGRTPPANAEEVRRGFHNCPHSFIEGSGHGNDLFISSPEIAPLMLGYLKNGSVSTRRIVLPPLRFEAP